MIKLTLILKIYYTALYCIAFLHINKYYLYSDSVKDVLVIRLSLLLFLREPGAPRCPTGNRPSGGGTLLLRVC